MSRRLDRSRPLWEVYLVEGLEGGRFAVFSKAHQVLVDGVETLDMGQLMLDDNAEPPEFTRDEWTPGGGRSAVARLVAGASWTRCAAQTAVLERSRPRRAASPVAERGP